MSQPLSVLPFAVSSDTKPQPKQYSRPDQDFSQMLDSVSRPSPENTPVACQRPVQGHESSRVSTRDEAETSRHFEKTPQAGEPREETQGTNANSGPQKSTRPLPGGSLRRKQGLERTRGTGDDEDKDTKPSDPNSSVSVHIQEGSQQSGDPVGACLSSSQAVPDNGQVLPGNEKAALDPATLLLTLGPGAPNPDWNDPAAKGPQLTQQNGEQAEMTGTLQPVVQQLLLDKSVDVAQLDKSAGASQPSSPQVVVNNAISGTDIGDTSAQLRSEAALIATEGPGTAVTSPAGDGAASASRETAPIQDRGLPAASNPVSDRNPNKGFLKVSEGLDPNVEQPLARIQQLVAAFSESPTVSSRPTDATAQQNNSPSGNVIGGIQVALKGNATVLVADTFRLKEAASLPMMEVTSAADSAAKLATTGKSGDPIMTVASNTAQVKVPIPAVPVAFRSDLQNSEKQPELNLPAKVIEAVEIRSGDGRGYQTDSKDAGVAGNPVERTMAPNPKLVSQQPIGSEVSVSAQDLAPNATLKASHSPTGSEAAQSVDRGFQTLTGKPASKTQTLMGQGDAGGEFNPMSRTLSVGSLDHSTLERSASTSDSHFWTQAEKASVVAQLMEKAQLVANSKNSELFISLKPEFLGRLSLHAAMQDEALVATITAESPAVKTLLESHIPVLQQALQEQGLSVSKISVVQGNELSFSGFHPGSSHPQQNFEPQQAPQTPWLDSMPPLEPEPEETELLLGSVMMPNRSLHLFA